MSGQDQLFIQYTASGRSTRDAELLDSKARAHAARYAHRRRRAIEGPRRTNVAGTTRSEGSTTTSEDLDHDEAVQPPRSIDRDRDRQPQNAPRLSQEFDIQDLNRRRFQFDPLGKAVASPQSYPVALDPDRFRSIDYFPQLWSRWAADVIPHRADRQDATSMAVATIVQRCLTDELHMLAFISYVLQRTPSANVSKIFLLHTAGKALAELRRRIESGTASLEEVVWPIIFLAHYELFGAKSVAAGRAHLKAVVDLGGMEYLDEVTKVYIRRMDRGWWSDYPSIFPQPKSPRQQWRLLVPDISFRDTAGLGFMDHATMLGSELKSILPFAIDCVRAGILCTEQKRRGTEDEVLQNKVIRKCQTLMDELRVQLPTEAERTACIYPVMIWLQYTTWVMRDLATSAATRPSTSAAAYRKVTSHAQPNLLSSVSQSMYAHEMALWAAAVGIATSSDQTVRVEYAAKALDLAGMLAVIDLKRSWSRYMWFDACSIIDYGMICAALDEAVGEDPALNTQQWQMMRRLLLPGL